MKFKFLHAAIAGMIMIVSSTANAGIITWDEVQNSTDFTDVLNSGNTVEAINATKSNSGSVTVNGIQFNNAANLLSENGYIGALNSLSTGDSNYDNFLNSFNYGNGANLTSLNIGGGNLVAGVNYSIQLWFTDLRSGMDVRDMYFDDNNGNSIKLNANGSEFGQFVIGRFTATGSTQELNLDPLGFGNSHITGYQVRVPEPSTLAILALAIIGLASRRFKKQS
ncbi:PEP-CTERM sorting domain-containing protein [Thalassotalea piscium]